MVVEGAGMNLESKKGKDQRKRQSNENEQKIAELRSWTSGFWEGTIRCNSSKNSTNFKPFAGENMKYRNATVADVAEGAKCSRHIVRVLADRGLIKMARDYNNWRLFPDVEKAIDQVKKILDPKKKNLQQI